MLPTITSLDQVKRVFFIGVAGTGMSALAQYLSGMGKEVSGSDRYFQTDSSNEIREKLELEGVRCFPQDGSGIGSHLDLVVVSTAIENTVPEVQQTLGLNIPILKRSELLALISKSKKTIAIGGTSGKSTTSGMLFDILNAAGLDAGIISGAGLVSIIKKGKIGNAYVGKGEWLIIEADESDGSIVQYHPEIGLLLNVDKDHQEMDELIEIFGQFRQNSNHFVVNKNNVYAASLSKNHPFDFSTDPQKETGIIATDFAQEGMEISFKVKGQPFHLHTVGKHNMENALAAVSVASFLGVDLNIASSALAQYEGIYRRHQLLGIKNGVHIIDDYAHNPVKCASSIEACQPIAPKVIAWFQPHGYGPTRFLKNDFIQEFIRVLRPEDEIWMSEIFYAGGTATKDISSEDLIREIKAAGKSAFFVSDRNDFPAEVRSHLTNNCVLLLMGARDPGLESFSKFVLEQI
jgi:UDP-N-acetylmuramate--alanine ligase